MQLSFVAPYLSITSFETVDLPAFTIITGPNGIGKTHLLKAIQAGQIRNDFSPTNPGLIQFADNSLNIGDAVTFQRSVTEQEVSQIYAAFQKINENGGIKTAIHGTLAITFNLPDLDRNNVSQMFAQVRDAIVDLPEQQKGFATQRLDQMRSELIRTFVNTLNSYPAALRRMQKASSRLKLPIFEIGIEDVLQEEDFGDVDFLAQSFSRLFLTYHQRLMANKFNQFLATQGESVKFFTDESFILQYGSPPWDLVNDNLLRFNPDIEIVKPSGYPLSVFTAYIRDRRTGQMREYGSLSSGERVFFSLLIATYKNVDARQGTIIPNILLLDEVDATLHPSMVRKFLDMVLHTIVRGMGVNVILTTHSPTTVALAEEGSVFVMDATPKRLRKVGKNQAIAELTTGVPFLSLTFDGRRQIFVESPTDARIYNRLYSLLRSRPRSERSLDFIPVGNGGEGSGCSQVRLIVNQLVEAGNRTVFSLLDWDGESVPSDRLKVLAFRRRNGMENVLLDPLLIACLIVRDMRDHLADIGLSGDASLRAFADAGFSEAPRLAAAVQDRVFGSAVNDECVQCMYQGGLTLNLRRSYLVHDDHGLENQIRTRFPRLNETKARAGSLGYKIADGVLTDYPELIPCEIADVFRELLEA